MSPPVPLEAFTATSRIITVIIIVILRNISSVPPSTLPSSSRDLFPRLWFCVVLDLLCRGVECPESPREPEGVHTRAK